MKLKNIPYSILALVSSAALNSAYGQTCSGEAEGLVSVTPDLEAMASAGDTKAEVILGRAYLFGLGVTPDESKALTWLKKAADDGDGEAQLSLGEYQEDHAHSVEDYRTAADWYRKAADRACPAGYAKLGDLADDGKGQPEDKKLSFDFALKAAEFGYVPSQTYVGIRLLSQSVTDDDRSAALKWIRKAWDGSDTTAGLALAAIYLEGIFVPADAGKARDLLEQVYSRKDKNYPLAAYTLGVMYMDGKVLPEDNLRAFEWMAIAAYAHVNDSASRFAILQQRVAEGLPPRRLATSCSVFRQPTADGKEYFHADTSENVAVLFSLKKSDAVLFPDRSLWGFVSDKCLGH